MEEIFCLTYYWYDSREKSIGLFPSRPFMVPVLTIDVVKTMGCGLIVIGIMSNKIGVSRGEKGKKVVPLHYFQGKRLTFLRPFWCDYTGSSSIWIALVMAFMPIVGFDEMLRAGDGEGGRGVGDGH